MARSEERATVFISTFSVCLLHGLFGQKRFVEIENEIELQVVEIPGMRSFELDVYWVEFYVD